MSMRKTTISQWQRFRSVQNEQNYFSQSCPGPMKTHVNSYRRQTVHRGKVDPGVSELPLDNELPRNQMNRPLGSMQCFEL